MFFTLSLWFILLRERKQETGQVKLTLLCVDAYNIAPSAHDVHEIHQEKLQ